MTLAVLSLLFLFNPSDFNVFPKCPFYATTGWHCPGCGSQRALHNFLHGNIIEGFKHNFLIILLVVVLLYDGIVITLNKYFKKNYFNILHHPNTTKGILVLIILFWIFRNLPFAPFSHLAP